ncbi:MAG: glutamine synthetase family protein [Actinomycetes bacterium]
MTKGMLTPAEIRAAVADGSIDTVLVVFPDLQGRLMGKRVVGDYFVSEVLDDGALEACNYLLALDVDMTPLPGYHYANWEQGYGDFRMVPDLTTLRRIPWIERTALVMCDLVDEETGKPVEVSPRQILKRQIARAEAKGYFVNIGAELEFFLFRDSYEEAADKGYSDLVPHSNVIEDYHILQTTRDEYLIREIRNSMNDAGIVVEFSKGEAGKGQHEINLRYAEALRMADRHAIYKNGAKEIAALAGRSITFMAKYSMEEVGSSCHLHSSVWSADGSESLMWDADAPDHMSDTMRGWLGGIIATGAEFAWLFAPYVNSYKRYQPESWAPTALAWGRDNRTCGYRLVGHGSAFRMESRVPGADVNPYLAYAATIAAGLHGIEQGIDPGAAFSGNAYADDTLARVPHTLVDAITALEASEAARAAFGDEVHHHLVNTARQEWHSFNRVVTDWERRRNFEQI